MQSWIFLKKHILLRLQTQHIYDVYQTWASFVTFCGLFWSSSNKQNKVNKIAKNPLNVDRQLNTTFTSSHWVFSRTYRTNIYISKKKKFEAPHVV